MIERFRLLLNVLISLVKRLDAMEYTKPSVVDFCSAIKQFEGYYAPSKDYPLGSRSWRNNNPGNIRCNAIMDVRAKGKDPQGFCIFPDSDTGFFALVAMVERAVEGRSKYYKPEMTIKQYFSVYAPSADDNDYEGYAAFVGRYIGVDPATFTIKELQ